MSGGGGRCLVTGSTGFIGGHVARRLAADGCDVRCLVRPTSDVGRLAGIDADVVVGDLTDAGTLGAAVDGCRWVVHCGALVSDWATVGEIVRINVHGTRAVAAAAAAAGAERFVHVSTTDVYGHPGAGAGTGGVDETYVPARFANWYAETKRRAEREVLSVPGLAVAVVRPATVYGPGSREVVGEIARALRARQMLLIDRGRAVAGLSYVENVADAAVLALRHPAAAGQAFNIADGVDVTWRRFVDDLADGLGCPRARWSLPYAVAAGLGVSLEVGYRLLRRVTGLTAPPLLSRQAVQVLGVDQVFSTRRAREALGWAPRVGYADGLAATLHWLRGGGRAAPDRPCG